MLKGVGCGEGDKGGGVPLPTGEGIWGGAVQKIFLHFHVQMAHFWGYFGCKFKFYCINKTVKIHKNPKDASEYDTIKKGKQ